jgi:hypothetical protein
VTAALRFVDRFWRAPAPAERLAAIRLIIGGFAFIYVALRSVHLASYAGLDPERFSPVGICTILDRPLLPAVVVALVVGCVAFSLPFLLGWRYRVTAPIFAALLLWTTSYTNSWGKILHVENLLVLHVAALALVPAADAYSLDARAGRARRGDGDRYGWAIRLLALLCISGYVLAGVAKLKNSGFAYLGGETLRNYVAFDNVRKIELGSIPGPLGEWLLPHLGVFRVLAITSLVLELGAPLALLHRRLGHLWSAGAWAFHLGVLALMGIAFIYPLTAVAFAPFFAVERLVPKRWR